MNLFTHFEDIDDPWVERSKWLSDRGAWENLTSLGMIKSARMVDGSTTEEIRLFITSLPPSASKFEASTHEVTGR